MNCKFTNNMTRFLCASIMIVFSNLANGQTSQIVRSEMDGQVILILPKVGDRVELGKPIVLMNCVDLLAEDREQQTRHSKLIRKLGGRTVLRKRREEKLLKPRLKDNLEKARREFKAMMKPISVEKSNMRKELKKCELRSPADGYVSNILVERLDAVVFGQSLVEIN